MTTACGRNEHAWVLLLLLLPLLLLQLLRATLGQRLIQQGLEQGQLLSFGQHGSCQASIQRGAGV